MVHQLLTAVISPLSTVRELVNLGLWYTLYPGSFGGGGVLGECLMEPNGFWVAVLNDG